MRRYAPDSLVNGALDRCSLAADRGVVVVTRFDCHTFWRLVTVRLLHLRLSRRIRAQLPGLIVSFIHTDVAARRILSVTLFGALPDVYQMGAVSEHIRAAKASVRLGVATRGGVFPYAGDWRAVLFAAGGRESPLVGL